VPGALDDSGSAYRGSNPCVPATSLIWGVYAKTGANPNPKLALEPIRLNTTKSPTCSESGTPQLHFWVEAGQIERDGELWQSEFISGIEKRRTCSFERAGIIVSNDGIDGNGRFTGRQRLGFDQYTLTAELSANGT
jgi:hypothetical protein